MINGKYIISQCRLKKSTVGIFFANLHEIIQLYTNE